eukprot:TRINITY_DN146_c1_g1_i10.p2 TRINITY_DN146_c1_g1~~TRINITY_DN146_c1_g1_i10.p2  ORF type:complete len:60 (+),score=4.47 TRINITY_DN146_c1_g1_i10:289-468(+)
MFYDTWEGTLLWGEGRILFNYNIIVHEKLNAPILTPSLVYDVTNFGNKTICLKLDVELP